MLSKQKLSVAPTGFFYRLSTVVLVLGWLLFFAGAAVLVIQLWPIVQGWRQMFDEGYGVIHGDWLSPQNYNFLRRYIE